MKNCLAFLTLSLCCHVTTAQDWYDDPNSYEGVVILANRSTVRGVFSYNQSEEYLYFNNGKKISAEEALYFQFYSQHEKNNHYFFSLNSSDRSLRFFELLLNGKIQLYQKSILVEKSYIDSGKGVTELFFDKKMVETQLYINESDTVVAITDFEKQILPLMKDQIRAISAYITSKQLDIKSINDQLLIIDHYNDLFLQK